MMEMAWTDKLATNVRLIDDQHKEIFNRCNSLYTACREGKGKEEVLRLLEFLEEYVKEHFAAEERLQVRYAYPLYDDHKEQHARFMVEVGRLAAEIKAEGATLALVIKTNQTLTSWLMQHISKTDGEMAAYLRDQGV